MEKGTRASTTRDRAVHVLVGALGLSWLYSGFVYYLKHPAISSFVGILNIFGIGLAALAVLIAVSYFTSNDTVIRGWLVALWAVASLAFNVLRIVYEGQKDDAGKWILLGTIVLMLVIAILYLSLHQLSLRKTRRTRWR
jgi:hypothetical protein